MDEKSIGSQIKKCREDRKLKQNQLAAMVGIKAQHLYAYESGDRTPSIATLSAICKALNVEITLTDLQSPYP